jgi:hypothetical protein
VILCVVYLLRIFKLFHGLMNNPVYIKLNFKTSLVAVIDSEGGKLLLTGKGYVSRVYSVPPTGHVALIILSEGKVDRNPQHGK